MTLEQRIAFDEKKRVVARVNKRKSSFKMNSQFVNGVELKTPATSAARRRLARAIKFTPPVESNKESV